MCVSTNIVQRRAQNIDFMSNVLPRPGRLYVRQHKYNKKSLPQNHLRQTDEKRYDSLLLFFLQIFLLDSPQGIESLAIDAGHGAYRKEC